MRWLCHISIWVPRRIFLGVVVFGATALSQSRILDRYPRLKLRAANIAAIGGRKLRWSNFVSSEGDGNVRYEPDDHSSWELRRFGKRSTNLYGSKYSQNAEAATHYQYDTTETKNIPEELIYLRCAIDFEGGQDRGALAGKKVLVYTPMKTGSVTLYQSISRHLMKARHWQDPQRYLLHNHHNKSLVANLLLPDDMDPVDLVQRPVLRDLIRYKEVTHGHIQFVSSFRDPLERVISEVSQVIEDQVVRFKKLESSDVSLKFCHDKLRHHLLALFKQGHPIEEIEPDFFRQQTFDHETKSCYVNHGHYEILMLCLEHVEYWEGALETYLGYSGIEVGVHNTMEQKSMSGFFREFKDWLTLDGELIKQVYFGEHALQRQLWWFYTEGEIDAFYQNALKRYSIGLGYEPSQLIPQPPSS